MGLFEYLRPTGHAASTFYLPPPNGFDITLTASVRGRVVGTTTVRRLTGRGAGVVAQSLTPQHDGVFGTVLRKPSTGLNPAVLVFGGSGGGLQVADDAALLAAHGYPTLALAYFKEPGLPQQLSEIPLEYFAKALKILRAQPGVDPRHVLVWGTSRGSEAAQLLGVYYPDLVNGVIAAVPSSVANVALGPHGAAWTFQGRPVPTQPEIDYANPSSFPTSPGVIPDEQIRGPLFLVCGTDDQVWPSCTYQDDITARLRAHRFAFPVTALRYPNAGHAVGAMQAYLGAVPGAVSSQGGTDVGNQTGAAQARAALLAFLAKQ